MSDPRINDWIKVAKKVVLGDYRKADKSTRDSLIIGLQSIKDPDCEAAMKILKGDGT
jgi:hypothetical protein